MGAAGKAFIAHTKANSPAGQAKDGGWGQPPHPVRIVRGQRFWPRGGRRRIPVEVRRVAGDVAECRRLDAEGGTSRLRVERLLAVRDDGQGRAFQFLAYRPGRYDVHAYVHGVEDGRATLVVPDWHPRRPVAVTARMLPIEARHAGAWLTGRADLAAPSAARLGISDLRRCAPPGPEVCHPPDYAPPPTRAASAPPAVGAGCGDIVLERNPPVAELRRRGGLLDVFVRELPGVAEGGRVYLSLDGGDAIDGFLVVAAVQRSPNGALLRCRPDAVALDRSAAPEGRRADHVWRWRWWPREDAAG